MTKKPRRQTHSSGQIVVEYVLILIVVVGFMTIAIKQLVKRGEGEDRGLIIRVWSEMLDAIGGDSADETR